MKKKWVLGMYPRLSFDEKSDEESNSIVNQKKIIEDYLIGKDDIVIYKCYVDDGYTGTDFNRPGYKQMLDDIKKGKINGVIVKDLSRLGRNYIEVGNFIDEIVPSYGLRFISVNDNVDSYKNPNIMNSLEIPFKNLMNESYSKDASKKMRTSLKASKNSGNFIGKNAPYGYLKDPEDNHRLIIDKDASLVVKRIFESVLKGKSKQEIISELEINNIPTPSAYLKNKFNIDVVRVSKKWSTAMLDNILKNETYIGSLVQCKRTRISHKMHNLVRLAEDEWIISKDKHKPIIKSEIFHQVQNVLYNRNVKVNISGEFYKYTGFVKCLECGCNLYRRKKVKHKKEKYFYYCSTYIRTKKCNKHYIQEKELDEIILKSLNQYINLVCNVSDKIDDFISISKIEYNSEIKKIRLIEIDKELIKYRNLMDELLKDYKDNSLSQEDYNDFKEKYLYEINKLNIEKESLNRKEINSYNLEWINKFKKVGKIECIDRNIVGNFIENIYVGNNKEVEIKFRFKDQYKVTLGYLKNQENML